MEKFDAAVCEAGRMLVDLQKSVERQIGRHEADIFQTHIALLRDSALREEVSARCLTERINVEAALDEAIEKLTSAFAQLEDPYFRERAADLRDIGKRLLDVLAGDHQEIASELPDGSILVMTELLPSLTAQLASKGIRGLVVEEGGQTAHAAIMVRAQGIPMLIRVQNATRKIQTNDTLIVDGLAGRVFVNPSSMVLQEYEKLEAALDKRRDALRGLIDLPAATQDGVQIKLCGNVGKVADAAAVAALNADGVGLYRTEFVFMVEDHFPSEEEQYRMYRSTAEHVAPRAVAIRLLDVGSDKMLSYFPLPREANPSLGSRGIRLLLKHPDILKTQLRAILRLSATHAVSILIPMVGDMEELRAVQAVINSVKTRMEVEKQPFNRHIAVGAMIETPSAVIMASRLARSVDFLSIGTNDLVQYLLTVDRASSELASYYEPLHPAVLQVLASLATEARAAGKDISICGEMAGNPSYTQLLLGLGYRSLSVNPVEILEIKDAIRSTSIQQAETLAKRILDMGTAHEVRKCLHEARATPIMPLPEVDRAI